MMPVKKIPHPEVPRPFETPPAAAPSGQGEASKDGSELIQRTGNLFTRLESGHPGRPTSEPGPWSSAASAGEINNCIE
jgi:hypothetical protein